MVWLGLEHRTTGWWAHTNALSYADHPRKDSLLLSSIWITSKGTDIDVFDALDKL